MELSADESTLLDYTWFFILAPDAENGLRGVVERVDNYEAAMRSYAVNIADKREKRVCLHLKALNVHNHRADSYAADVQKNKLPGFFPQNVGIRKEPVPLRFMMEVHEFHSKRFDTSDEFTKVVAAAPLSSAERLSEVIQLASPQKP